MPTAPSSTESTPRRALTDPLPPGAGRSARARHGLRAAGRALADVGHLAHFRAGSVPRRRSYPVLGGLTTLTVAAAMLPAYAPGARGAGRAFDVLLLLPVGYAAFLVLAIVSAIASGGGRELLPRDQAVGFPVSPTTDHLGALLMAPLNISWLLQAWLLLGATAYAAGPDNLPAGQLVVLLWIAVATALGQVVAWGMECLRRQPRGIALSRAVVVGILLAAVLVHLTGRLGETLDRVPTLTVVLAVVSVDTGLGVRWALTLLALVLLLVGAVAFGAWPARVAARRMPHDESRGETGRRLVHRMPGSDAVALLRVDRASIWRAVPMRRGLAVLAIGPGLIAFAGGLEWETVIILPGLVASGGALLFGVNAWCLDGRGALWRGSLPTDPGLVFGVRAWVLTEWLLVASAVTILLASLRAGMPTAPELAALLCTWVVVSVQVVALSMRWSIRRPFPVDMRSARATPAPPVVMLGYSARLAAGTTLVGLVFSGLARLPVWQLSVLFAVPLLLFSFVRLVRAHRAWGDPVQRARVVTAVSA